MAERARITDIEVLKELRVALLKFAEEVGTTLSGVDSEVQRVGQWLTQERGAYWKHETRRREDKVQQAKAVIAAKQLAQAPNPVSVAQERKDLQRAQHHLEDAVQRHAAVKRWAPVWDREAQLYKSSCSGLGETLQRDIPDGVARLERMMRALEAYLRVTGVETAEQESAAVAAEQTDLPRFAPLRAFVPDGPARAALAAMPLPDLRWAAGNLPEGDAVAISRLSLFDRTPAAQDKVVFAWRALESTSVFLVRGAGGPGDTGWYIGPEDRPEAWGGLRAATVAGLSDHLPWLKAVLGLAVGSLVVVKAGSVAAVLDESDRDAWASGRM
jgi:hypothetical protein